MKKAALRIGIILIALSMTNCATIVHGNRQTVSFSSQPVGAKIYIDGKEYGTTPKSIELMRVGHLKGESIDKNQYQVKIELDGYYPYETSIKRTVDGWLFGNIVIGGLIGIIIDAASGSMYKLTPEQVNTSMGKNSASVKQVNNDIYIAVSLHIDPKWQKIGQLARK